MSFMSILLFLTLLVSTLSCKAEELYVPEGGVFVSEKVLNDKSANYESIYPVLALRFDRIIGDTLLVKYRFGDESFMNIDLVYNEECNCFVSIEEMLFSPDGSYRERVVIKFLSTNRVGIFIQNAMDSKQYEYILTYIDEVDISKHRDIYYAEDGFKLFKD